MDETNKEILKAILEFIMVVFIFAIIVVIDFLWASVILRVLCLIFGFTFTWKAAIGFWIISIFLNVIFGNY